MDVHPDDKIADFTRAALDYPVHQARYPKNCQESVPEPENQENLQTKMYFNLSGHYNGVMSVTLSLIMFRPRMQMALRVS